MPPRVEKTHEEIEIDRESFFQKTDAVAIQAYRRYAQGKQPATLTTAQLTTLENVLGNDFCDNVCHQIIAEDGDRVELLGLTVEDQAVQAWLDDWWVRVNLDDESGETHYAALRDGNYAVSLSWSDEYGRVCIHREPWWDGTQGVFIAYDAVGEPLYAVKDWMALIDGVMAQRRLVWYEDRLERYVSMGGGGSLGFQPYVFPGEKDHVLAWEKADGSPLHIPIVHFANAGRGPANYGVSELSGGVLGFQDQINDLHYDITAAARMTAFQQGYATGVGKTLDSDGAEVQLSVGAGNIWRSEKADARFGVLPAGDMSQLISVYNQKLEALARMTRTPRHTISGGDWPSGKALERAELPLINKVNRQIKKFRAAWQTVAHRATEIANVYDKAGLNEDANITANFAEAYRPDKSKRALENLEFWQGAQAAQLAGYPVELYLKREGWKDDEIAEYQRLRDVEEKKAIDMATASIDAFRTAANAKKAASGL